MEQGMTSHTFRAWIAPLLLSLLALPVWAAEPEHGGAAASGNIFAGDLGTIIWTLVVFLLVVFVLGRFAWTPILSGLKQREDFIFGALEKARLDREAAAEQLRSYEQKLATARAEATALVDEGRRDADIVRHAIEAKAREEAEQTLARAKREINIAKETAIKELYTLSGQLATEIAGKIVGRELKPEDHERLIREALDQLGGRAN
jgi:F-type H+-transporting ATPase subunit b